MSNPEPVLRPLPDLRASVPGLPLLGHALNVRRDVLGYLLEAQRLHPYACQTRLGTENVVLCFHPEAIAHVLVKHAKNYNKDTFITDSLKTILGNGLLTNDGDHWARQRRAIQPLFSLERAKATEPEIDALVLEWIADLKRRRVAGAPLNMTLEMLGVMRKIISQVVLGEDLSAHSAGIDAEFEFLTEHVYSRSVNPLALPGWMPTPSNFRFAKLKRRLNEIIFAFLDQSAPTGSGVQDPKARDTLLDRLAQVKTEDGRPIPRDLIRDEIMTMFLAGHETTANSVVWFIKAAVENPEWIEELRAENDPVGPKLQAFIHESYRLYPPAWSLVRRSVAADHLGTYRVAPKTLVLIAQWATHRHPDFWREPDRFDPARFLPGAPPIEKFAFLPFGAGPRVCIGNNLALIIVRRVFFHLIREFNLRDMSPRQVRLRATTTLSAADPVFVTLQARPA